MKLLSKPSWVNAKGAWKKARRLHIKPNDSGLFECPVLNCDSVDYKSLRGCRKHIYVKHGWYFYFDTKPNLEEVLPKHIFQRKNLVKQTRSHTAKMPSFELDSSFALKFLQWICSTGGGSKTKIQSQMSARKVLKFLKFCCADTSSDWDIPFNVVDYCLGSLKMISDFIYYLQEEWSVGFAGVIGYMNSLSHLLDFRRSSGLCDLSMATLVATEIYLARAKKSLSKSMRRQWHDLLNVDHLNKIDCWASLEDLQLVIPFHSPKFMQIVTNATKAAACIPSHDLSFSTSFIVAVLFLMVKATRPMTFQFLTVNMIQNVNSEGIIDLTSFKTQNKYGFDSLVFTEEVLLIIKNYIALVRPRLNPSCEYLLINRNGTQLVKFSDIFGRIVFNAIGKYIHPTRYRQIVETESSKRLSLEEQFLLSEDQKHTSNVARIHYKKLRSQDVAKRGFDCMQKLRDNSNNTQEIKEINNTITEVDFLTSDGVNKESNENFSTEKVINNLPTNGKRKKKTPFSELEDDFLRRGILKHGAGRWSSILCDEEYSFDSSRKPATLQVRAKLKKLI